MSSLIYIPSNFSFLSFFFFFSLWLRNTPDAVERHLVSLLSYQSHRQCGIVTQTKMQIRSNFVFRSSIELITCLPSSRMGFLLRGLRNTPDAVEGFKFGCHIKVIGNVG